MMKFKRGKGDLPKYLDKKGYYPLITDQIRIISLKDKKYIKLPLSNIVRTGKVFKEEFLDKTIKDYLKMKRISSIKIMIPKELHDKEIKQIRIVPEYKANYFTVNISYIDNYVSEYRGNKTMAIDLGVNNLAAITTSDNEAFLIDGRKAKSINQLYNKKLANFNSKKKAKTPLTKRQLRTLRKRNLRIEDFFNKATRQIIDLAMKKEIGEIIIGYNKGLKTHGIKNDELTNKQKAV
ncbi:MAG: transposase, partial [Erysipelotrichales bacterium]|nr:transposase [Erysipelotrichales bacterium]